uniref:Zinc finger protein 710 n=1 Tax=Paramormyrops kingsleyae TaxID=1676925 RepID=A0A3B3Q4X2_9TELE|nr:zinc finger protein 366 [Paramormyrops kingsleyae]XP_023679161.1 zinc finger protein 366 [Paramormyrops kingsleyae]XP_023679162.1 zinc finger protein 366 [Paramormyrops kingsleyae]XP_023679163.1 zinc finger protein 366 [Paramormyrops kingsleyae]
METDIAKAVQERGPFGGNLKAVRPCLKPLSFSCKPRAFAPLVDPLSRGFPQFSPPVLLGYDRLQPPAEAVSWMHKMAPFKRKPQDIKSPDELLEGRSALGMDLPHHAPYPLLQPSPGPPSKFSPQMIDLNRFKFYRNLGRFDPKRVKQEPVSSDGMWPPSHVIMPSPSPFFPALHSGLIPYPFLIPGPAMHLPPHSFYQREPLGGHHRGMPGTQSGATGVEKLGLNVHVDDSYYVDVGGEQKRWKCRMCEKSYTSKYNLVTHILGHSGIKPHCCSLCGKLFKQLSHLHTHMLTHQGTRPHKCQVCHKAFTQTSHLKRHMMQHSDVKPYSCGVCARGFAYPSELRAHEMKHEKGQENVCVECGLDFPTLAQLKRHLTTHRGPTQYSCTECQKTFQYPSQLQNHMMKHKDIRPYICTECGMEFIQSHHLKQHTLTHKGVKEHKCRICGREFTLLANMKRHVLIHTNIRAYQCHLCFKSFVQKQTLKAHMIVHSDVKPYKCKLCGKEFNRMHNLMGHMHLHSDSKPFKCLYCSSKFTLKGNLTRHMKVKHGIMERGAHGWGFRERGRFHLPADLSVISQFSQEEPFDLSKKTKGKSRLSQSDGDSAQGSLCLEEDDDSLYRMSQYSSEDYQPSNRALDSEEVFFDGKSPDQEEVDDGEGGEGGEELSKEPMKMETCENKMHLLCGEKSSLIKLPSQQMSPGKNPNINGISQESCENQ